MDQAKDRHIIGKGKKKKKHLNLFANLLATALCLSLILLLKPLYDFEFVKNQKISGSVSQPQDKDGQDSLHSIIFIDQRRPFWLMTHVLWKQKSKCLEL